MFPLLLACSPSSPPGRNEANVTVPLTETGTEEGPGVTTFDPPTPPAELPTADGEPIELCINELAPNTRISFLEDDGLPSDWIELHNPTAVDVSLDGWSITDDPAEPRKQRLDGLAIEAGGFLVLWADDRPELGAGHLGFALSDEGEAVALFSPAGDGSVVWFGPVSSDLALARSTDCCADAGDGESCFEYLFAGTPGASNEE